MKSFLFLKLPCLLGSTGTRAAVVLALSTAPLLPAQTSPNPPPTVQTIPEQGSASPPCPIRVDEAYLTADPASLPAQAVASSRTLHVTLVDTSGKQIVSYVVHAKIDLRPTGTLTDAPKTATVVRKWHGDLEPDMPAKEHWTFPADRFTMGLHRVWFDKVAFADGTTWNKSTDDSCSFAATGRIMQTKTPTLQP